MQWDAAGLGWDAGRLTFVALALVLSSCPAPKAVEAPPRIASPRTCRDGDLDACEADCAKSDAEACFHLAAAFDEGEGKKQDRASAATHYQRACDLGFGTACGQLAVMMLDGVVAGDEAKAAALCAKGCEAKSAASCALLGSMYQEGTGVPADAKIAAQHYARGCDLGEARACSALGYLTLDGRGVPPDLAKGRALVEKGCKAGDPDACKVLGELGPTP